MKMQMGSLILCNSMMLGSASQQSQPTCAGGYDDFALPSKLREPAKGCCDKTACVEAEGTPCTSTEGTKGCNRGSRFNTCAMVGGECMYAENNGEDPFKPKKIYISYSSKSVKAAGLAATSDPENTVYRLILYKIDDTDEKEEGKLRLIAVNPDTFEPLDQERFKRYPKDKQAWYLSGTGVFNNNIDRCLQLDTEGCSGGDYCLRALSDSANSCTSSNELDGDGWRFRQGRLNAAQVRIDGHVNLCMGTPNGGEDGLSFSHLHATSDQADNCDTKWSALYEEDPQLHSEPLLDLKTTVSHAPWTCESCKTDWPTDKTHDEVKHFLCATEDGCLPTPGESACEALTGGTWCEKVKPSTPLCMDDGTGKPLDDFSTADGISRKKCSKGCDATVCKQKMHQKDSEGHFKAHNTCVTLDGRPGCNYAWDGSNEHTCAKDDTDTCVYANTPSPVTV